MKLDEKARLRFQDCTAGSPMDPDDDTPEVITCENEPEVFNRMSDLEDESTDHCLLVQMEHPPFMTGAKSVA